MPLLHPTFTKYLFNELQKNSLNIYAPHGQGQLRLLEDLKQLLEAEGDLVFLLKMKSYAESYNGFIQQISNQIVNQLPEIESQTLSSFGDISTVLDKYAEKRRSVLLLHDFDALLDNPQIDESYDVNFFNNLNALKNKSHRLVCITERPHNQSQVFVRQKVHSNSWLDLKRIELPPLSYDEIKQELLCYKFKSDHANFNALIDAIKSHPQSYQFLDFVRQKLMFHDAEGAKFNKRLKKWHKEFSKREKDTVFKGLHRVSKWSQRLAMLTGINKLKTPFVFLLEVGQKFLENRK